MFNKKSQIIKFEQNLCDANVNDNSVLFVKVSDRITDKNAFVEIPASHTALIVKGGSDVRYHERGPIEIFDNKNEIKDWKKGFSVDVIYIAKNGKLTINWGTPNQIMFRDEASNRVVRVGANGEFDISVANPLQFFETTAVCAEEFDRKKFSDMYRNIVVNQFTDMFLRVLQEKHLTYDQCDANKLAIGESIGEILDKKFNIENGLSIKNFLIKQFIWSEDDKAAMEEAAAARRQKELDEEEEKKKHARLKEILAELERLDDKQWEREKYLRQLELQDKTAYYEVMKVIGKSDKEEKSEALKCPVCGTEYKPTDKFCPNCGKRVSKEPVICPDCGHSNKYDAKFCANCGKSLIKGDK